MSEHSAEVFRVGRPERHPNADSLEIFRLRGWQTCCRIGEFQEGDLAVFIEPDTMVPTHRPEFAFLADKAGRDGFARIKAKKLRGERCYNPKMENYKHYGGRGITVCHRWRNSFRAFVDDMGSQPSTMEISRIDNDKSYLCGKCEDCKQKGQTSSNCEWATKQANAANKRNTHYLEYAGERLHLAEWARRMKTSETTILRRLQRGWTVEEALSTPIRRQCTE